MDIVNDVAAAVRGSREAMTRLRGVEPARWRALEDELEYFVADGDLHTPDQLRRMGQVLTLAMDSGGREVLARCLGASSTWTTRLHAAELIDSIGTGGAWAANELDAIAGDEAQPVRLRNAAARAAARVTGRPAPAPIELPPLPRTLEALGAALDELDWNLREPVVECANELGAAAKPILAAHFARWRDAGVSPSRLGGLVSVCVPLEEVLLDALAPEAEELEELCEIAAAGLQFRPELEPRFERLLVEAPTGGARRAAAHALAHVTGEHIVEWLTSKSDELRRVGRERLARVAPEHLARQGAALFAGIETELAVWGWETADLIVAALARASEDALVDDVTAYFLREPPDDSYWRPALRPPRGRAARSALASLAERHRWARRVEERLA